MSVIGTKPPARRVRVLIQEQDGTRTTRSKSITVYGPTFETVGESVEAHLAWLHDKLFGECPVCRGTGRLDGTEGPTCTACRGTGNRDTEATR